MFVTGVGSATAMRIVAYQAQAQRAVEQSMARIASGRRFTSFADDSVAATREVSLRSQQGAAALYLRATQDAAGAADAASSGLQAASDLLIELRNDVLALDPSDSSSVAAVQQSVTALTDELTRIGQTTTTAGGKNLLDGSIALTPLSFTVAGTGSPSDHVDLTAIKVDASVLGTSSLKIGDINFADTLAPTDLNDALDAIDAAQAAVLDSLASTGAVSSAMSHHAAAIGDQILAIDTGLDNLVGVDVAQETVALTANQLRQQAAVAILAQAGALQQSMIQQLLRFA